ncbi:hypothetical protein KIH87_15750 [Paraneptunicella aestuarii]|uniref:hypothetical protein n=1 Tax=Paraneptunicella aestuarii TaxID=2831148 RepID=UPI001E51DD8B|nr:hypothetical protein [Paraneptunicella aestuarii]UAA38126.1 hypothetical protein KIH87_15750 [Paraneptunicella aestuarii]
MLDLAIAFVVSNVWIIGFFVASLYNYYLRPEHTPIIHVAFITVVVFALSHIAYSQWVSVAPDKLKVHYLYLSSSAFLLASTIYLNTKRKGFIFYWPIRLIIGLMLFETLITLLIHIDRNIFPLNGAQAPNVDKENSWWLWSFRNLLSHVNNIVMLISLFLPVSLVSKIKNYNQVTEANAPNVYILNTSEHPRIVQLNTKPGFRNLHSEQYIKEIDNAYARVENIQDLIDAMPQGEAKNAANQFAYTASELITRQDQSKMDFMKSITLLCDNARDYAIYVEKQEEAEQLKIQEKAQEQAG